jgi:hypothetical protein
VQRGLAASGFILNRNKEEYVKKSAMVLVCVLLLTCWAQAQPSDPDAPAGDTSATPASATSAAPAEQQSAPATAQPPADQQSPPPATQPASQAPAQTGQPNISAPPELPKYPDVRMPGEAGFWVGISGSEPTNSPIFDKGRASGITTSSLITFQGRPKLGESAEIGFAIGLHNALVVSGFNTRAAGDFTSATTLTMWSQAYDPGVLISTNYHLQELKLSFEYLTWPYPVESRHFRLKTLWQVQYVNVNTGFDAPLLPVTSPSGGPLIGANGTPVSYQVNGARWFLTPTLGLGATEYLSKFVRLELNGSGFALPRRWTIWDTEGSINFRFGHFELGGGARAFHFKTSTNGPYYIRGTLIVPQVSLRWYSK